jgi:hypothetical protein
LLLHRYILTCGIDGDVRIWAGLEDDDPSSQCVGEQALTVIHKVSAGKSVTIIFDNSQTDGLMWITL